MSMTAVILRLSLTRRADLAATHGRDAAERALFTTAARLIAGDYTH